MKQRSFSFTNVSFIVYLLHGNLASSAPKIQFQKIVTKRKLKSKKIALGHFRTILTANGAVSGEPCLSMGELISVNQVTEARVNVLDSPKNNWTRVIMHVPVLHRCPRASTDPVHI